MSGSFLPDFAVDSGAEGASTLPPFKPLPFKGPAVDVERRADGTLIIRSRHLPGQAPRSIAHLLADRAAEHPQRPWMARRDPTNGGRWRTVSYGEAKQAADAIATWLLRQGLTGDDCVMVLSGNSIEHALLMLACYTAGVPIAPISPAYSLLSNDHNRLRQCAAVVRPRVVFAQSGAAFGRALATLKAARPGLIVVTADGADDDAIAFDDLRGTEPGREVDRAMTQIGPHTVAKYLFTSGSTSVPKGVIQSHGMFAGMIAAQEGIRREPRDPAEAPISLEWMPWSHISAGNIGFNDVIWTGGTVYLDDGKPTPTHFATTLDNLREVSPVMFASAPVALAMLATALEQDLPLRQSFFKNLRHIGYGGATLSNDIYERLQALAVAETGRRIALTTMYGATETQGVTAVHWTAERVGLIGLPLPGMTLKLVPTGARFEVRVKGPTVTPGYLDDPERTATAFDDEDFYRLGDAARFVDPDDPAQGLVFDGRVAEDFKLSTGTWVAVGTLRPDLVAACAPYVADAVIAGHDRSYVGALVWPSETAVAAVTALAGEGSVERLAAILRAQIATFNAGAGGSSRKVARFFILTEPPSVEAGEITDKGYVNQRATLERRASDVAALFAEPPGTGVVTL